MLDQQLFWNVIHYFYYHNLPYDLFLPYKQNEDIDAIIAEMENKNSLTKISLGKNTINSLNL